MSRFRSRDDEIYIQVAGKILEIATACGIERWKNGSSISPQVIVVLL